MKYNEAMVNAWQVPSQIAHASKQAYRWGKDCLDALAPPIVQVGEDEAAMGDFEIDEPTAYCSRCGQSVGEGEATTRGCSHCVNQSMPWQRMYRLSSYDEPMATWIRCFKFRRHWTWSQAFGQWLSNIIAEPLDDKPDAKTLVIPVPMHWQRRCFRGYNQSALIAQAFCKQRALSDTAGRWVYSDVMKRTRRTTPQSEIHAHDKRLLNVRDAITMPPLDLSEHHVLLIDDVMTTGATLRECCKLIKAGKPKSLRIGVVAVAGSRRKGK